MSASHLLPNTRELIAWRDRGKLCQHSRRLSPPLIDRDDVSADEEFALCPGLFNSSSAVVAKKIVERWSALLLKRDRPALDQQLEGLHIPCTRYRVEYLSQNP